MISVSTPKTPAAETPITCVVSGMRPTGKLHLGHYAGVIENWLRLEALGVPTYFFVADWHSLTTEYEHPDDLRRFSQEMVIDWLASGIDPEKAVVFLQSHVPAHAELHLLFSMMTPIGWLERVPTYKELRQNLTDKDLSNYGFLGYPVLQAADVALYGASHVPVGEDQVAHLELAREIVRRFHYLYKQTVFVEPQSLLTAAAKLPGLDGRKMSKSYDNCIYLSDDDKAVKDKIARAYTDPKRLRRTDPGEPHDCNIYQYHKVYTDRDRRAEIESGCRSAGLGCVDCKKILLGKLEPVLAPIRERRAAWVAKPKQVADLLENGEARARAAAAPTLLKAKTAAGL